MASGAFRDSTIQVQGLREFTRLCAQSEAEFDTWLRDGLLAIGERVADDTRRDYRGYSAKGAAGIRTTVWKTGQVRVGQSLRKSRDVSRTRKNFGGLMMRHAFLPALDAHKAETEASAVALLDRLEEQWL